MSKIDLFKLFMFYNLIYQFTLATKNKSFILSQKRVSSLLKSNFASGKEDSEERGGTESFKEIGKLLASGTLLSDDIEKLAKWIEQNKKSIKWKRDKGKTVEIESADAVFIDDEGNTKVLLKLSDATKLKFRINTKKAAKEFGQRLLWNGKPLIGFFKRLFMREEQTAEQQIAESLKPLIEKIMRGE